MSEGGHRAAFIPIVIAVVFAAWIVAVTVGAGSKEQAAEASASQPAGGESAPAKGTVTLQWVGDITLGSRYGLPPDNAAGMFAGTAAVLGKADVTIGNLEGTLSTGGASKCPSEESENCFAFQAPAEHAAALSAAGFDLMNLANNHAYDFGADGQSQTIHALDRERVAHAGLPGSVTHLEVRGLRLAFVGFAPYPWATSMHDIAGAQALVAQAATDSDLVVVLMHAGAEGSDQLHTPNGVEIAYGEDRGDTRGFARAVVDAGADLVFGSGPHVIRGIERYHGRLIAYSLGNFAGWHNFGSGGNLSLSGILDVRLRGQGDVVDGRWHSVVLTGPGVPALDDTHTSARLVDELSHADFTGVYHMDDDGRIAG